MGISLQVRKSESQELDHFQVNWLFGGANSKIPAFLEFEIPKRRYYKKVKLFLFYGGEREEYHNGIKVMPVEKALKDLRKILI